MLVSLCAETVKSVFDGDKSDSCGMKCISLSGVSCKPYNQWGEGGVFEGVGGVGRGGGNFQQL